MTTETNNNTGKIVTTIAILLLIGSVIYLSIEMGTNSKLKDNLKTEKLNAETLLSQKLALDKEIVKLKSDLKSLEGKNSELDKILNATSKRLEGAEQEFKRLQKQNNSATQLKKQNQELLKIRNELEQQLSNLSNSLKQLQSSNEDLEKTVELLQEENKKLRDELNLASLVSLNDVLIESAKKNYKLTVKAKKTKKFILTADVPAQTKDITLKVTGPKGNVIDQTDLKVKVISNKVQGPKAFYVSDSDKDEKNEYKRVEIIYTPKVKLTTGTYKLEVLNESQSIGSLQVKLR